MATETIEASRLSDKELVQCVLTGRKTGVEILMQRYPGLEMHLRVCDPPPFEFTVPVSARHEKIASGACRLQCRDRN